MTHRATTRLTCIAAMLLLTSLGATAAEQTTSIENDPRPVLAAATRISNAYGFVFTYEEPVLVYPGDMEDKTPQNGTWKPGSFVAPRRRSISFHYPIDRRREPDAQIFFQRLVEAGSAVGDEFKVEEADGVFHLIPTFIRDAAGKRVPYQPIFDHRVSFDAGDRPVADLLSKVCEEAAKEAGVTILDLTPGYIGPLPAQPPWPWNGATISYGAVDRPVREVLTNVLMSGPSRKTWHLIWGQYRAYHLQVLDAPSAASMRPR